MNVDLTEFLEDKADGEVTSQSPSPASRLESIQDEKPLFNMGSPAVHLQREKAYHRMVAFLKAQGMSNVEVAERVGVTPVTVAYVSKQPFVAQMIVDEIAKAGRPEVEVILQGAALDSVNKLIEIRDSEQASPDVQRKAANDLLDRVFGKPNQPISHSQVEANSLSDAELAKCIASGRKN